ncbi:CHAP domain-containing protein [Streptomyces sp. NA04227]|uniref:CHAP domain-containing protein n=1 Tax=Streptomyces sp. NA04227 TaxID=2742136 RepID=UPI0015915CE0|nr:CHAP domain-containing protein [Streptomyces sp. NA04227]QKW07859.1 CHAP domain-containing protein [Streptomyces sp. NA04227]
MRTLVTRGLLVIALIAAMVGLVHLPQPGSASADDRPPTRTEVLDRARVWLNRSDIPYSMSDCYTAQGTAADCGAPDTFRADCSGFVSLAWGADNLTVGSTSPALTPLGGNPSMSHEIGKQELEPGDALAYYRGPGADAHIALFVRWQNEPGGAAVVWEQAGGAAGPRENVWSAAAHAEYKAFRLTGIRDDGTSSGGEQNTAAPDVPAGTYWVSTFKDAPGRGGPSRTAARVGTLREGRNYVRCAVTGDSVTGPEGTNNRWFLADLDDGATQGWVSAYYAKSGGDNEAKADDGTDVPACPEQDTPGTAPPSAPAGHGHNHYVFTDASPGGKQLAPAVRDASRDDGAPVISWKYGSPDAATANSVFWWGKRHDSEGAYKRLHAEHSGTCVTTRGDRVVQSTCGDDGSDYWAVADEADGTGKLKNLRTGTCVHIGWGPGDPVVLGTCDGDRSRLAIATSGPTHRDRPRDTKARAAGQRAADIAMREYHKEIYDGNVHSAAQLSRIDVPGPRIDPGVLSRLADCNFYSGRMNGPATKAGVRVCAAVGKPDWGRGVWCSDFARYAWREAGGIAHLGTLDPDAESFKKYGKKHGTWHPVGDGYTPRPGDAVVYKDGDGDSRADHVGIVYQHDAAANTYVVSGNAGPGEVQYKKVDTGPGDNVQGFTSPVA